MGLNRTGLHHSMPVAWFALSCLIEDITRHHRKEHA